MYPSFLLRKPEEGATNMPATGDKRRRRDMPKRANICQLSRYVGGQRASNGRNRTKVFSGRLGLEPSEPKGMANTRLRKTPRQAARF